MSLISNMPMKFTCSHCSSCYMHPYQSDLHHYPACPDCKQQGSLEGMAELTDLLQHPMHALNSYLLLAKSKFAQHA